MSRRLRWAVAGCALSLACLPVRGGEHDEHAHHDHHDHHAHHQSAGGAEVVRSEAQYRLPDVTLQNQDGAKVSLAKALDGEGPVMVNFIYTTCTAICPVTSQTFAQVQAGLAPAERLRLVSISIDPEQDTPARLREYAARFKAGPRWQHYTGTVEASLAVQRAFETYRGDKMNHEPVTFLRAAPGKPWIRLEGFASPEALLREFRTVSASR